DGIIISHNDSGLRLYSKMYSPSLPIEDLIVGLIDGVNSSLKSNLAISSINNISFIDKQIFISYGKVINVLMITSNINIITRRLAKYLCDQFEKEFGIDLVGIDDFGIVETSVYNRFDVELAYVNSYFLG
ncbi:MAG: hypothetical protein OEZ01_02415, partial [Candidatus Heimdallarchaeota archaeon]|nr:hypothetical protein [Candidatus Heimdallarchaeota archaeon]